jgi:Na+-transporting NADH:ubiquinone oxidoreductase subunit NqrB
LTDILFEIISGATVPFFDDAESVRSLLVVTESAQLMMDLITDDAKNTSSQLINSAKLGEWKKKLVQWKVLDSEAQSMVHFAVKELVKTAESKSSSEGDCSGEIYDRMAARRQHMLHTFNQALSWLEMFVGYLAGSRSGIDTLTVIKATIASSQCLSWNGLKNEKTSLLRAAIDIFVACTSIPNLSEISWSSLFGAVLNLNISEVRSAFSSIFKHSLIFFSIYVE